MTIKIPNQNKRFSIVSDSDVLGNINYTRNISFNESIGRITVAPRGMIVNNDTDLANLDVCNDFRFYSDGTNKRLWTMSGNRMFYTTNPSSSWTQDATAGTPTDLGMVGSMELFNNSLYVIGGSNKVYRNLTGVWSSAATSTDGSNVSTCIYGGRLYFSNLSSRISSINLSNVITNPTGTPNTNNYSVQLSDYGFGGSNNNTIVCIRSSSNRIWIATSNAAATDSGVSIGAKVFEWDGVSTIVSKVHEIRAAGILSMVIKDDIPYIIDSNGNLLSYNGRGFGNFLGKLPLPSGIYLKSFSGTSGYERFLHPNGMCIRDGKINMLINNELLFGSDNDTNSSILTRLPSGIWEYDENIGLYCKNTISTWKYNSTTTRTDYSQIRLHKVGALYYTKFMSLSTTNSDVIYGMKYYTSYATTTTSKSAIGIIDTLETQQKMGCFVTQKIESQSIQDTWQKICIKHKKLLNSTDKIIIKYRTSEFIPIEGRIDWVSTTVFTSTLSLGSISIGDEVEIISATGAGQIEHISNITFSTGTYTVTLENSIIGATGTSRARFDKWYKIGTVSDQIFDTHIFNIGKSTNWIQLKCVMYFTGKNELNELELINTVNRYSV